MVGLSRLSLVRGWFSSHGQAMKAHRDHKSRSCMTCIIARDLQQLTNSKTNTPLPPNTMNDTSLWSSEFVPGQQQDAEEAFQFLLAACDTVGLRHLRTTLGISSRCETPQHVQTAVPYYNMFGGVFKTTVRCASCAHVVHTTNFFTSLQLHLKLTISSLNDLLKAQFQSEPNPGDYKCCNASCN